jgi:transaldolase
MSVAASDGCFHEELGCWAWVAPCDSNRPRPALFLDRDGVIIEDSGYLSDPSSFSMIPGAARLIASANDAGIPVVVVTNQAGIGRGYYGWTEYLAVQAALTRALAAEGAHMDAVFACPYHPHGVPPWIHAEHPARKPRPGMLLAAERFLNLDLGSSWIVGDTWNDLLAGYHAGLRGGFHVLTGKGRRDRQAVIDWQPEPAHFELHLAESISAAVPVLRTMENPGISMHNATVTALNGVAPVRPVSGLRVKLFADGADLGAIRDLYANPLIQGFTTNPTLMRKAGITDYQAFARDILSAIPDRPISFEVFADEFDEMERQAHRIAAWGLNVYVKIPITNTRGESACELLRRLTDDGVQVNVTALLTLDQVRAATDALAGGPPSSISVFAGRIADTGRDPVPVMAAAVDLLRPHRQMELIWASPRELLNIYQADAVGCHIITATTDILKKLPLVGKSLDTYSLETVKMFFDDARSSGFEL